MVVGLRVESENITTGEVKHCNSSYFTMVAKDDNGKATEVPGLIINNKQAMRRFARSKERKLSAFKRDNKYDTHNFKTENYLDYLKGENLKLNLE